MRRPELARAALAGTLALASALLPAAGSRAGIGSLYTQMVCREMTDIPGEFDFETSFLGLKDCQKLCLDAALVCVRDVNDAASCQLAFASDWIASDSRLDCDGLSGSLLADCRAGWASDKQTWQSIIKSRRNSGRAGCGSLFANCNSHCSGT